MWLRPLQAIETEGRLRLYAPNQFVIDWVRENALARIHELTAELTSTPVEVSFEIGSRPGPAPGTSGSSSSGSGGNTGTAGMGSTGSGMPVPTGDALDGLGQPPQPFGKGRKAPQTLSLIHISEPTRH